MEDSATHIEKLAHKNARLKSLIKKYKQSHHLQHALLQLSEQASTVAELTLLYPAIHNILQDFIPSKSFYVVLNNPVTDNLELSYFADEKDGLSVPLKYEHFFKDGLTGYVFKHGKTSYFSKQQTQEAVEKGLFKAYGTPAEHWVGVPVYREKAIIGVMVAQSYDKAQNYTEQQIELLEVMSLYLATAIERVKKRELLESEVKIRTRALTQSNQALNDEILQRKKALDRQQILFKISELATLSKNVEDVYAHVHEIIKTITYADNLYIALYDQTTNWLSFPYCVDEFNDNAKPRPFAKGYSELVLSTEKCQVIDEQRAKDLIKLGVIERPIDVPPQRSNQLVRRTTKNVTRGHWSYCLPSLL